MDPLPHSWHNNALPKKHPGDYTWINCIALLTPWWFGDSDSVVLGVGGMWCVRPRSSK